MEDESDRATKHKNDDDPSIHWERLQESQRKKMKVLKEETEKLQKEKDTMNVVGPASNNDDDIFEINVGGKVIFALRSTLCLVAPDTMFSHMFSGRWDGSLTRDSTDRVFLDHDPELIEIIVNFLRTKKIEDHSNPVKSPTIPDGKKKEFETLLHYFGLSDFFYPSPLLLPLDIANIEVVQPHGSVVDVTKGVNKIQFTNASRERYSFVACKPSLDVSEEGSFWKVTIDVLPDDNNHWIYLGIIGNIGVNERSYSDSTSYGWAANNQVFNGGSIRRVRSEDSGWTGFTEGECLYFHLKSDRLTMLSVQKNLKFVIGIATTAIHEYYIHFNFSTFGAKISLEPLSDEERKLLSET